MNTPRTNEVLATLLEIDGELSEDNAPKVLVDLCKKLESEAEQLRNKMIASPYLDWLDPLDAPKNTPVLAIVDGRPTIALNRAGYDTDGWCHASAMSHLHDRFRGVTAWLPIPDLPNK